MSRLTLIDPDAINDPRGISRALKPMDSEIDRIWGEPVVLKPMKTVSAGYREAVVDETRMEVVARGIFDQSRGANEATGPEYSSAGYHRHDAVDSRGTDHAMRLEERRPRLFP